MNTPGKVVIVVPTIRENNIKDFLAAWEQEFALHARHRRGQRGADVQDRRQPTSSTTATRTSTRDLGKDAWIIPRKTDCVRSYGYFKAWQKKPDMMITLDDDCYPERGADGLRRRRTGRASTSAGETSAWVSTLDGIIPRGVPYEPQNTQRRRPCVLNHGLWNNVPDFDAPTQMLHMRYPRDFVVDRPHDSRGQLLSRCAA